jgi:hypothetical protein
VDGRQSTYLTQASAVDEERADRPSLVQPPCSSSNSTLGHHEHPYTAAQQGQHFLSRDYRCGSCLDRVDMAVPSKLDTGFVETLPSRYMP